MKEKYKKITLAPFCYSCLSLTEMVKILLICIVPQLIMLIVTKSHDSLYLLFLMIFISVCTELLHNLVMRTGIKISWETLLQGALIGLLIPETYSPILASIATLIVLFFEKSMFKKFAQTWLNPIILTALLLYFLSPELYPSFMLTPENVQFTNIGTRLFTDNALVVSEFDTQINAIVNSFLKPLEIQLPEGYITLFFDSHATIPAFRFNAMTLLASIILFATKTLEYLIPIIFIAVYSFLVYAFSLYPYGNILGNGDILLALFTSGTLFTGFFLLTWFGTTPKTFYGKISFAVVSGVLAFLICGAGTSAIGMIFVVLLMNIYNTIILHIETIFYDAQLEKTHNVHKSTRG